MNTTTQLEIILNLRIQKAETTREQLYDLLKAGRVGLVPVKRAVSKRSKSGKLTTAMQTFWVKPGEENAKGNRPVVQVGLNKVDGKLEFGTKHIIPGAGKWVDSLPQLPASTVDWHSDGRGPKGEFTKPKKERESLHRSIMDIHLDRAKPVPSDKMPICIMMMGGPASGKSSAVRQMGLNLDDFVVGDANGVKEMLPEYREAVQGRARNAAAMAHEESSYLVKKIHSQAIKDNKNLVIDGTGAKAESYISKIKELRAKIYHVQLIFVDTDPDIALKRAQTRAEKTGRYVPDEIVTGAYETIPDNFREISRLCDDVTVFNSDSIPPIKKIMERSDDGSIKILDAALVNKLSSKQKKGAG